MTAVTRSGFTVFRSTRVLPVSESKSAQCFSKYSLSLTWDPCCRWLRRCLQRRDARSAWEIASVVAMNAFGTVLNDDVALSDPCGDQSESQARLVPLPTPTQCSTSQYLAKSCSNPCTIGSADEACRVQCGLKDLTQLFFQLLMRSDKIQKRNPVCSTHFAFPRIV